MRAAIYARVSTTDQAVDNQLLELRRYVEARGWTPAEYVDMGVSGAKDRRPELDRLLADAKRRKFDVLVVWRLDRLGRNLKHLVVLLDELQALGISFVSMGEGIDCTTPAGRLQLHVLAALAEFERGRIQERSRLVWPAFVRQGNVLAVLGCVWPLPTWSARCRCPSGKLPACSASRAPSCIGRGCPENPTKRPIRFRRESHCFRVRSPCP